MDYRSCFSVFVRDGQVANFTDTTFAKWELAVNTPHKVKPVKTTLSNIL
jgi:hypothetical protein